MFFLLFPVYLQALVTIILDRSFNFITFYLLCKSCGLYSLFVLNSYLQNQNVFTRSNQVISTHMEVLKKTNLFIVALMMYIKCTLTKWGFCKVCFKFKNELYCTFSQNHRILRIGRALWKSSSPIPLPKQGHLEQVTQECVQVGLECLQRWRLHDLCEQLFNALPPQSKEIFLMLRWNFMCFSSWPLLLVLSLGTTEKSGTILLTPSFLSFLPRSVTVILENRCWEPPVALVVGQLSLLGAQ